MLKIATVLTCALLICSGAWATVYQWTDSQGIVHMTDDPDKVPAKYRKVLKTREMDTRENVLPAGGPTKFFSMVSMTWRGGRTLSGVHG
jgi:hypothetical protein